MCLSYCRSRILKTSMVVDRYCFVPRRYRYKRKWAVNLKASTSCQQALSNFDAFYKPYFGDDWPSIRVSLLSLPKYCAVINKFSNAERIEAQLEGLEIMNFVEMARLQQEERTREPSVSMLAEKHPEDNEKYSENDGLNLEIGDENGPLHDHTDSLVASSGTSHNSDHGAVSSGMMQRTNDGVILEKSYDEDLYSENLNVFMPTEQVFSENDQLLKEEMSMNFFQPRDVGVEILSCESLHITRDIDAFVFAGGDVSMFPQPKSYNRIFGYYLMDAASVMPVIALDVRPADQVLDLCAAPGGKSYLILQSLDMHAGGSLCCNDSSPSRIARLRNVLTSYFPADIVEHVHVTKRDGSEQHLARYNKVLVDVPCNSDRHVVTEEENNLFKPSRVRERLGLMKTQKELLLSAIRSCVPGGTIVFSTCTLSPAQNDGVIQAAVEELWETSQIEVAVQDLSPLVEAFSHVFKFHGKSRYGQLILPTLVNNFGPSYFAKLRRVK